MANWNLASRREKARASLGGKPLKEEEAPTESFKEIIVDKANKEISIRSIDLFFPCKSGPMHAPESWRSKTKKMDTN